MLTQSIAQLRAAWQREEGFALAQRESYRFQQACAWARRKAQAFLERLDAWLLAHKPEGWQVVGQRTRTLVTRFGEVTFRRRLYRDPQGKARFLPDEVLELPAYQAATADVTEAVVALAAETAFVRAAQVMERLTGGVLSSSTIWRLVQQVGQAIQEAEAEEVERGFGQGQPPRQRGPHVAPRLYMEADGVMVRQRTGEGHTVWREVRCGLAYDDTGREQAYVQGPGKGNFWEAASLVWGAVWDGGRVEEVVLSGDDAAWIEEGWWLHPRVMRQRDGFPIARAACRAAGAEQGAALRAALQAGAWEQAAALWAQVPEPGNEAPSQQRRAWAWLDRHLHDPRLVRWWRQKGEEGENLETLGHIESQVRALIAHRMKGKGRHGSARGLRHLAKGRQELRNGRPPFGRPCPHIPGPLASSSTYTFRLTCL